MTVKYAIPPTMITAQTKAIARMPRLSRPGRTAKRAQRDPGLTIGLHRTSFSLSY
jgi:hypothetical protein